LISDELVIGIIIVAAIGGLLFWVYNSFVRLTVRVNTAWADIDVQLRRRYDLVPLLVEAVKAYAAHERTTFEEVARLRDLSAQARTIEEREEAERSLETGLKTLLAVAENYPELKAAQNFLDLQRQLVAIEDDLQHARRYYNGAVRDLNTRLEMFPVGILGSMAGFRKREFFQVDRDVREALRVQM
jgi:LemA protein